MPSAVAIRHISIATSQDLGPSSTSGRMWQWISITNASLTASDSLLKYFRQHFRQHYRLEHILITHLNNRISTARPRQTLGFDCASNCESIKRELHCVGTASGVASSRLLVHDSEHDFFRF